MKKLPWSMLGKPRFHFISGSSGETTYLIKLLNLADSLFQFLRRHGEIEVSTELTWTEGHYCPLSVCLFTGLTIRPLPTVPLVSIGPPYPMGIPYQGSVQTCSLGDLAPPIRNTYKCTHISIGKRPVGLQLKAFLVNIVKNTTEYSMRRKRQLCL